ncbi:MAG TPA: glycosyl transferase family 2, partial [Bacteroidetes bacterium]|nr:glycosyl transferase family 2 [Bacteroidota bacterium]
KSKKFGKYHLGYLPDDESNEVDVLAGAFMLLRKETLDQVGLLDETFFMYGEDIDLSYRITEGGWKNYYFAETSIIHYKGESTKKGSLNYVFMFYQAMIIFARKHFEAQHAKLFSMFIQVAIYLRAGLAIQMRFIKQMWLPVVDLLLIFTVLWLLKDYYASLQHKVYDSELIKWAFGAYALTWVLSVFFSGGYDRPIRMFRIVKGVLIGSGIILMGYSLLPEELRFSRALILLGTLSVGVCFAMTRTLLARIVPSGYAFDSRLHKRFAIVATKEEFNRIKALLVQTHYRPPKCIAVSPLQESYTEAVGSVSQLDEIVR